MKFIPLFFLSLLTVGCFKKQTIPKPNAFLKLNYPNAIYTSSDTSKVYRLEHSTYANFSIKKNHWGTLYYPNLNAQISITYQPINNNLKQLVRDAEKLTYKHTLKADNIQVYPFENSNTKVYARLFKLTGNVASPLQFQATDSIKHFLYGSLYFNSRPNYDSILPAIDYVQKDVKHLIESLEWLD